MKQHALRVSVSVCALQCAFILPARLLAQSPLATPTGQALFARHLQRQIAFFNDLVAEYDLSRMPVGGN